jgi:ribosomal protein L37AE/L43A
MSVGVREPRTDGSAAADAHEIVRVDRHDEPYRWRCPNGHTSWDRTNAHIWCHSCRRAGEGGADVEAEHYEIVDAKRERAVPYSAVEFAGEL